MFTKKTDKIVLIPFVKLFTLILLVTVFIMLMQFFLVWFEELIGKDLGFWIYVQLFCYFGINATPFAFPLATVVASLMVFGSLGEQLELTALKSAGISFMRILRPLFILISLFSLFVYFSNAYIVPKVTVKAHGLLYDLRKKKPSVAIKEGVFYNGIPDYSIRVERKLTDEKTLEDIIIYDHTKNKGNIHLTTAASGELTTIQGGRYLSIALFDGYNYLEELSEKNKKDATATPGKLVIPQFYRTSFKSQKVLIDLDELKLTRTSEKMFTYYHSSKTTREIIKSITKMKKKIKGNQEVILENFQKHYHLPAIDSTANTFAVANNINDYTYTQTDSSTNQLSATGKITLDEKLETLETNNYPQQRLPIIHDLDKNPNRYQIIGKALSQAKELKYKLQPQINKITSVNKNLKEFQIEKDKRTVYAAGCIVMLLIGASLGALIKKGGLGIPLLISTLFILIYYMMDMFGTKWAKAGLIDIIIGAWAPNLALLPLALFFLNQAQKDTRILESDAYSVLWRKIRVYVKRKRSI
jgi:lipopolysaccharide export system permease protein